MSPGCTEIGKVKCVSGVDVYQRSHKPGIKEIMLAHFGGPDQELLVYSNLTFNIVKPYAAPDWLTKDHVAKTKLRYGRCHPPGPSPTKQNINFCIAVFISFLKIL